MKFLNRKVQPIISLSSLDSHSLSFRGSRFSGRRGILYTWTIGMAIKWIYTGLLLSCIISSVSFAQNGDGQAGTESLFKAGFGARASALGQAYTALADDPSAVFWNPAGLEYVFQQSVMLYHMSLFEGAIYDFMGYSLPTLKLGTFAVGIARISAGGDIIYRDIEKNELGTITNEIYQAYLSYAKKLPYDLSAGVSIRVLYRSWTGLYQEGSLNDYGVGLDLGVMWRPQMFSSTLLQHWSVGLNIHNLFPPQIKEGAAIDELPLSVRLGFMRTVRFLGGGNNLNILIDLDYSQKRDLLIHFGTEYRFMDMGMVRLGYDGAGMTFGAGVEYKFMQIDYAYGNSAFGDYFPAVHKISLSFNFGQNRDELSEIAEAERIADEERLVADMRERDRQKFITQHMQTADDAFAKGEMFNAVVEYQQVISQDPYNQRANVMLDSSNALLQKQFDNEQTLAVRQALDKQSAERDQAYVDEHFNKGRRLLDQKQYTEALIEFNIARERDPQNAMILAGIRTTQQRISQETNRFIRQARQELQNGNYAEAWRLLSEARLLSGDDPVIQREIEPLVKRIELQEKIQKGLGFYEIGEYDQALSIFEEALAIDPEDELVKQYYEKSKIETVGKTEAMDPETERRYLRGVDYFVKGEYREAISIWEEILKDHPYNKKVLKALKGARERLKKANQ